MFTSQGQAKRFFIEKIVAQAQNDGTPLSDSERQMLGFSESDPECVVNPDVVEKLQREISDEDYEAKVARLLERSWNRDVETDSTARDVYKHAFSVLSQGDHYLLLMIERAIGRHLRPWWAFWR